MMELSLVQKIAVWTLPILFAITVHEVAHGWVAKRLGDPTAYMMGRLTLNPFKHIDLIGTVFVPLVLLMLGGFIFGWAKPVPVTWQNLRNPKRDMAIVALAGPMANLVMAVMWAILMRLLVGLSGSESTVVYGLFVCSAGIFINSVLMVLNLLPLPPLDGGRIMTGILPGPLAYKFSRIEPYGFFILLGLLVIGWLGLILSPVLYIVLGVLSSIGGISLSTLSSFINALYG